MRARRDCAAGSRVVGVIGRLSWFKLPANRIRVYGYAKPTCVG
jgi:hypothetical protein